MQEQNVYLGARVDSRRYEEIRKTETSIAFELIKLIDKAETVCNKKSTTEEHREVLEKVIFNIQVAFCENIGIDPYASTKL